MCRRKQESRGRQERVRSVTSSRWGRAGRLMGQP
jgi:hypothetical protein